MQTKTNLLLVALVLIFTSCDTGKEKQTEETMAIITENTIQSVNKQLIDRFGEAEKLRIERGTAQVAMFWKKEDGTEEDFQKFCLDNFVAGEALDVLFSKLERNYEIMFGMFNKMNVSLMFPIHVDDGDTITPVDMMFGSYSPAAHVEEDFFANKIAFVSLLNFPHYTLEEKNNLGVDWDDKQWAFARLGDLYSSRVPAKLALEQSKVTTESDAYISDYNIYMGNLRDDKNIQYFDSSMKLISHWGLRDELKSHYGQANGLDRQKIIYQVMKRIINQEIPQDVINKNEYIWNPYENKLLKDGKNVDFKREQDVRYDHLRKNFIAVKNIDPYYPYYPTYIERKFEGEMQMPQEQVEKLFVEFVSAPEIREIGKLISSRLGRPLEPFDIWYDGFKSRSGTSEADLDKKVMAKYPGIEAFQKGIADILITLKFPKTSADFIASRIKVDGARGAGHAWGAAMKEDYARLRTRATKAGMDYKGFNIAMHELGHNVEQTITLHDVKYYFLNGVPNTAFTEALAFMFQKRDMTILGLSRADEKLEALDLAWSLYEIMGVSLVDMNLWKWLYERPESTPAQIREAAVRIARDIWNKYYADIFGVKDQEILAIYSHMIDYPLYLSAYPIGHLVEFQLEEVIKGKPFGTEIMRIFASGNLTPDVWMKRNTGNVLSNAYLLKTAGDAAAELNEKNKK
jgi:hypothetical protein